MQALGAGAGSVDEAEDPMDFLEPVTQVHDGPRCELQKFGALVGKSSSSAPVARGRVNVSSLTKARAQDLLEFMHHSRHEDGTTTFEGMEWLRKVPVSGGVDTMEDGLRRIRESVEELAKSKHVKIEKPTGTRWAVERWRITLL